MEREGCATASKPPQPRNARRNPHLSSPKTRSHGPRDTGITCVVPANDVKLIRLENSVRKTEIDQNSECWGFACFRTWDRGCARRKEVSTPPPTPARGRLGAWVTCTTRGDEGSEHIGAGERGAQRHNENAPWE